MKKTIKEIAIELFGIKEQKPSRSGGEHEISLESVVDRTAMPDQLASDLADLAQYIDHTILKPESTREDIQKICEEADKYGFASVCVNPVHVPLAHLYTKKVDLCSVVGFPLGAAHTSIKELETQRAIDDGATEIDMVMNIGWLKGEQYRDVYNDILAISSLCRKNNVISKVIIETCLLTDEEKVIACLLAKKAGTDFVKTSTGFSKAGAKVEDVKLMRAVVGKKMGVKASGGIRDKETAIAMLRAGANRIGASSSIKIIQG